MLCCVLGCYCGCCGYCGYCGCGCCGCGCGCDCCLLLLWLLWLLLLSVVVVTSDYMMGGDGWGYSLIKGRLHIKGTNSGYVDWR